VLNQLGEYTEAMQCLLNAKAKVREITDTRVLEQSYDETNQRRRELLAELKPDTIRSWREKAPASKEKFDYAFLGGHPRSGTTLLEQILDAHPDVLAFDEPLSFSQEILSHVESSPARGRDAFRRLDSFSANRLAEMRQRYTKSLLREVTGEASARIFG